MRILVSRKKHKKKVLKMAKGMRHRVHCYKIAKNKVKRALVYASKSRKVKKREFRSLWIVRLNAALREIGISYSRFIFDLKNSKIDLNRKSLSEISIRDPNAFQNIVNSICKKNQS